jgi:predicted dehydrogenase
MGFYEKRPLGMAICGLGVAGRARFEAISLVQGIELAGIISRRPGIGDLTFQSALLDSRIDAIAISTENTDHPGRVEQALQAKKHVLCDYPLALDGTTAERFYALARQNEKILHVAHISLLSEEHQTLKEKVAKLGPLQKGEFLFQAGYNKKLSNPDWAGPVSLIPVPRLVQVADLFGPYQRVSTKLEKKPDGFRLHLHLKFYGGGNLGFTEEHYHGLPRRRSLIAELTHGPLTWKTGVIRGGLFAKDLEWFRDRVVAGKTCYYDEAFMTKILEDQHAIAVTE